MLGLGVQQSDPVIHACIFFRLFFEMFFDSSHLYLVIMLIEGFKPFMFCFFLIGYKQTSSVFKKKKSSWQCPLLRGLHQCSSFLLFTMACCSTQIHSFCLPWLCSPQKHCSYIISWMILPLLFVYPNPVLVLERKWCHELCMLECTQSQPDISIGLREMMLDMCL